MKIKPHPNRNHSYLRRTFFSNWRSSVVAENLLAGLIVAGRSIGCGPAIRLAVKLCKTRTSVRLGALIAISAFTSLRSVARNVTASAALMIDRWNCIDDDAEFPISDVTAPTLFIHGTSDTLIPPSHTLQLAQKCTSGRVVLLHGATHNDGMDIFGPIEEFLRSLDNDGGASVSSAAASTVDGRSAASALIQSIGEFSDNAEVVVVGAGPVGLFFAACLAQRAPRVKVRLVERHEVYVRSHALRIDAASYGGAPDALRDLLSGLGSTVRTNVLEDSLIAHVTAQSNCSLIRGVRVEAFEQLFVRGKPSAVVCADGAHSSLRDRALGTSATKRETLSFIVDVRYEAFFARSENARKLSAAAEMPLALLLLEHLASDHVGRVNEAGVASVTLRFVVERSEYERLRTDGATFRQPLLLPRDETKLPVSLVRDIRVLANYRGANLGERCMTDAVVTAVELSVYSASTFAGRVSNVPFALVGDAAFGVPYFRALNNGLVCASELALRLADFLQLPLHERERATLADVIDCAVLEPKSAVAGKPRLPLLASLSWSSNISAAAVLHHPPQALLPSNSDPLYQYNRFVRALSESEFARARATSDKFTFVDRSVALPALIVQSYTREDLVVNNPFKRR
jgi:2-polyprenyl-6-methoxyphenol hydroxylase-like FAD-dependent oxidoreductase